MMATHDEIVSAVERASIWIPPPTGGRQPVRATPFDWIDPSSIPRRQWLYGGHYIRRFVGVTVAPGGIGKSSLAIAEALAMTSERPLLGKQPTGQCRVWYWNGEYPEDELQRCIMAAAVHYGLDRSDFVGRLDALPIDGEDDAARIDTSWDD